MANMIVFIVDLLVSGAGNLASYLAAHVVLCLIPAFLIAGAMSALIPKEVVTRYLGANSPKCISYPAATVAGFLLAVCSCTVIPLFAGIYKKGAGIGPAITFLFVAPAVNILALSYTGSVLGLDLALARVILSVLFGIGVGLLMAVIFAEDDARRERQVDSPFSSSGGMGKWAIAFLLVLTAILIFGTLQVDVLKHTYFELDLGLGWVNQLEESLFAFFPYDPAKGEEGITAQGLVMIGLLVLIGLAAWKGIEGIHSRNSRWKWGVLVLLTITLIFTAMGVSPYPGGVVIHFTGKFIGVALALLLAGWIMVRKLSEVEMQDFLWESWRFVKQIFPLLVVGVFVVGIVRELIPPVWIEVAAGENTVLGNFVGVVFGVFMYFPTLVEVPIAQMFLDLGMHRGPLLAYLISDPELSLQSILITASLIGKRKAWVYVGWVAVFSTAAGWLYGLWVNRVGLGVVAFWLVGLLVLLGLFTKLLIVIRLRLNHEVGAEKVN
jgi:uncharacterized membrane protein YraQ (UPF0718 family)